MYVTVHLSIHFILKHKHWALMYAFFFQNHLGNGGTLMIKCWIQNNLIMLKMYEIYVRLKGKGTVSFEFDKKYTGLAPQHFIDLFLSTFYF